MKKESLIILLGVMVLATTFSGFPGSWKQIIFSLCGVLTVVLGYQLRRRAYLRSIEEDGGVRRTDVFEESVRGKAEVTTEDTQL